MAKRKSLMTEEKIIEFYTDYCLTHNKMPNSVYQFAKENQFEESVFYTFFSSFEELETQYFSKMFQHTTEVMHRNPAYQNYDSAQKLTTFYFTFFELATANRSFVLYLLKNGTFPLKNLLKLKLLRTHYISFVKQILENPIKIDNQKAIDLQNRLLNEAAWIQFLSIVSFWITDTSKQFEKTDIFIEKSVKASFDLVYNVPVQSIIDFGKFVWKEKIATHVGNDQL